MTNNQQFLLERLVKILKKQLRTDRYRIDTYENEIAKLKRENGENENLDRKDRKIMEKEHLVAAFVGGLIVLFIIGSTLDGYDLCSKTSKDCRIQTCARLVTVNGVSNCEEWKP